MKMKDGEFYEEDEPIEKIREIVSRPPDFLTAGPRGGADVVVAMDEVSDAARARLEGRAEREGKSIATVVRELVERHA